MIRVAVSGYFNPLHIGHLDMIEEAKKLGDYLVVIVNNDKQVKLKGRCPFYDEATRVRIIGALRAVDEVVLALDTDSSVAETLRSIRPDIFANGGDRSDLSVNNSKEKKVCEEIGCQLVLGVGGHIKQNSSSELLYKAGKWMLRT
jgi:cytidyltransferase-like protein